MPQQTAPILPVASQRLVEMTKHRFYTRKRISENTGLSGADIQAVISGSAVLLDDEIEVLVRYAGMLMPDFLDLSVPLDNPFGERGRMVDRIIELRQRGASSGWAIERLVPTLPQQFQTGLFASRVSMYLIAIQDDPNRLTDEFVQVFAENIDVSVEGLRSLSIPEIKSIRSYHVAIRRRDKAQQAVIEAQERLAKHESNIAALRDSMSESARLETERVTT